ncbi:MAG: S8 family serine peptidase [Planctomycetaceae bacterium]|nr:S8 family serine peptidase [Planctomycetaceae bacterium]
MSRLTRWLHGLSQVGLRQSMTARRRRQRVGLEQLEDRVLLAARMAPSEILVQYRPDATDLVRANARSVGGGVLAEQIHTRVMTAAGQGVLERITLPAGMSTDAALAMYRNNPLVQYAEPNWTYTASYVSNDPYYTTSSRLWGMYSDDSPASVGPTGTTNSFGSQAEEAWDAGFVGSDNVYVGIIDEGFEYSHPDLVDNAWTNPFDAPDGIDNDGNGYIDDIHGWDFFSNDNSVYDGTGDDHGTHVAGTIGASGGNGVGVAGVNWNITMISTKFLGPNGGSTSGAVQALDYLTDMKVRHGINIVASNNSWGGGGFSQALLDAINRAANQGILFIAAAGNSNVNNDTTASYPSNYSTVSGAGYEAVVAVAAIDSAGAKASFSSYGATTVDIGAPGVSINSTLPSGTYGSYSGTSMATPHVTGAVALYAAANPGATASQIRTALLNTATPTASLNGITATGGRLNVSALMGAVPTPSLAISNVTVTEGNSGTTAATFTVTLSMVSTGTVTVNFATSDGTAVSTSDYVSNSGSLTFAPGETAKTIDVTINGDTTVESSETFLVTLSGASGATLADSEGVGTIQNDDTPPVPAISIGDVSVVEGNRNSKRMTFTIVLSAASSQSTTVRYATANGTATSGSDYSSASGTARISAGRTSTTISVTIFGDRTVELNETLFVNLSNPVNATIADNQAVGTIVNDDGGGLGVNGQGDTIRATVVRELSSLIDEIGTLTLSTGAKNSLINTLSRARSATEWLQPRLASNAIDDAISQIEQLQRSRRIDGIVGDLLIADLLSLLPSLGRN